jgi:hypothetical protein
LGLGRYVAISTHLFFVEIQGSLNLIKWNYPTIPTAYEQSTIYPIRNLSASIILGWIFDKKVVP